MMVENKLIRSEGLKFVVNLKDLKGIINENMQIFGLCCDV
jgi:hypothetical protein